MKNIIGGKMYNTDTAECLGGWANGYPYNDFLYLRESLYRKRTGEFFLLCEGGAATIYARRTGDGWYGYGMEIMPLCEQEAREWAQKNLCVGECEKIFGKTEE